MLGVTLFGIFLTPVFYYVIQWFADRSITEGAVAEGPVVAHDTGHAQHEAAHATNGHAGHGAPSSAAPTAHSVVTEPSRVRLEDVEAALHALRHAHSESDRLSALETLEQATRRLKEQVR
jgi:hypothetical protein